MNQEVSDYISKCAVCANHPRDQAKEPLIAHELPSTPWSKIACDLFEIDQRDYLITVDYYSSFFEIDRLTDNTNKEIVSKLKQHLARHGLPTALISDNGPPFNSSAFADFARQYGFEHVISSPGFAQSNGKVENAVKTAKSLIRKASESSSDPYLALLDWRNTPTEGLDSSPTQRLFSTRTRTLLPTTSTLLKPEVQKDSLGKMKHRKAKQALYFNVGAKELTELNPGDTVRVKPLHTVKRNVPWLKAQVQGKVDIRSYQVRTEDGRVYRRNRRHLFHAQNPKPIQQEPITVDPPKSVLIEPPAAPDAETPVQPQAAQAMVLYRLYERLQ